MTIRPFAQSVAIAALALSVCCSSGEIDTPLTAEQIEERVQWVAEVEAQDFDFWRRFANPPPPGFRQPLEWYSPMALVDGGIGNYFDLGEPTTITAEALAAAGDYAMERETQAFIVYHQGKIRYQRFMDGFHDTSAISSHSWVKTLHGILVGFALEDGDIGSLDDPIGGYLEEWSDDPRGEITIRQVLHNVTGLENPSPRGTDPYRPAIQMIDGTDINAVILSRPLLEEPGSSFSHNNVNTQLLGIILHRATGVRFDRYLAEKLWRPLGAQRGALRKDTNYGNVISYCCFLSAPSDWIRVSHLLMNSGKLPDGRQLLPQGWAEAMLEPSKTNPNYGLHIWTDKEYQALRPYIPGMPPEFANTHSEPFVADDLFYFDGGGKVRIWISPKLDLIVLRMGFPPPEGMGFDEAFIPNTIIRGIKGG